MDELPFRSAVQLAEAIRRRELSSRELLDLYLARTERLNPKINAVVTLDVERARKRADAADQALARGENWGAFHGLPMTVKDVFETAGMRTTAGAEELANHRPESDAVAVARLKAAGAIIFGKTNVPLYAGDGQSYNAVFGTSNNPWDLTRTPGGSSGGACAALAAGLTALELGSDIGGSIRSPAHFCGVYGHKPTFGIIPQRGHIPGPPGTLARADIGVMGPLARSADDLDVELGVLAGADDANRIAWRFELPTPRRQSLRDYRVAAWLDDPSFPVDGEVRAALERALEGLRRGGVEVSDRARPGVDFARAHRIYLRLLWPLMAAGLPDKAFADLAKIGDSAPEDAADAKASFARSSTIRHRQWLRDNEEREHIRARWASFFREYDILLCPAMSVAAIKHDHGDFETRTIPINGEPRPYLDVLVAWAGLIGMAYLPSTSAPVGRTSGGLPVGLQVVGPYLEDRTTIDFARRMRDVIGGFERPPGY